MSDHCAAAAAGPDSLVVTFDAAVRGGYRPKISPIVGGSATGASNATELVRVNWELSVSMQGEVIEQLPEGCTANTNSTLVETRFNAIHRRGGCKR